MLSVTKNLWDGSSCVCVAVFESIIDIGHVIKLIGEFSMFLCISS